MSVHRSNHFAETTLLITHYNRSSSLRRLLDALLELNCSFDAIVVADDCSNAFHYQQLMVMKEEFSFTLVRSEANKGLGHNLNQGQDAVNTSFTLYIQEDFVPRVSFPTFLKEGLKAMESDPTIDLVRFYAYFKYPYVKVFNKHFDYMDFKISHRGYNKFHVYSDHPHLKRSTFPQKFGRYPEGISGDQTEFKMAMSFLRKRGKAIQVIDPRSVMDQINDQEEPSTMVRTSVRESNHPFISSIRDLYRHLKFNYHFFFGRST